MLGARQIPNAITSIRILLVAPIAIALVHRDLLWTIALFGAAACSDLVDGFLAKRYGWQSDLGSVLDPIADKLLMATVFITLAYMRLVPGWLAAAAVARDAFIVLGALIYRFRIGPLKGRPSMVSKLNTLCQGTFIMAVFGREAFAIPPDWVVTALGALVLVTVVVSAIDYFLVWGPRLIEGLKLRNAAPARAADRHP
ncbi:MAG TPA: CDP-alcohol phosphatidyltransferase family protein [Steroidobacteraceae bacterium]|jgi:cardiolipin synthase|nr:CDP-alcohol phosphatidyltransferase family protein [Steroidobacteraceae bacterium]